jgi:beta-galactosidase
MAWYRRRFRLDPSLEGKWLCLELGAVATSCTVYWNGTVVARHHGGYAPFVADVTPVAVFGQPVNTVAVHVDAQAFEGWWYEGAGIYRHVWLDVADPLHVATWGTFANPVKLAGSRWDTRIETSLQNASTAEREATVRSTLIAPDGRALGSVESGARVPAFGHAAVHQSLGVDAPALWSLESPELHLLRTELLAGGAVIDAVETRFGYRTIRFDAEKGFFLNERPVKLKGTCNHQDHAGVGVAVPDAIQEWRIRRLKEMGSNAYRCAHNPPAPELLDACDRLGMLVMDEHRAFSPDEGAMADLGAMVTRDRNHPSIVLWSMFNEENLTQNTPSGRRIVERMAALTRSLDPSRPVTAAINSHSLEEAGVAPALDVIGINYSQESYDATHARFPRIPLVSSENTCVYATRGEARTDLDGMRWDNYDEMHTEFGDTARRTWKLVADRPFVAGCFVWTGFDYRGEPQPSTWPCASAHLGIVDTCGFAKDGFFLYRAMWTDEPLVHLLPHWSRQGMDGEPVRVMCYTNCDEVELYLDGTSLGARKASPFEPPEWSVPWAPGELRAEGRRAGRAAATDAVRTAGGAVRVRVSADRSRLAADGEDALPVSAWVEDAQGRAVPTASVRIDFSVAGPARVIGVGNGDPLCHEPDRAASRSLFNGLCQAILQSSGASGRAVVTASSPGLEPARIAVECGGRGPRPSVAAM